MGFVFPSALNSQIYSASILINFDSDLSRQFTINYYAAQDIKAVKGDGVIVLYFYCQSLGSNLRPHMLPHRIANQPLH